MSEIEKDGSRVIQPDELLWAKFFKPGEASLTENELKKRE
jgi:hypothetical protein